MKYFFLFALAFVFLGCKQSVDKGHSPNAKITTKLVAAQKKAGDEQSRYADIAGHYVEVDDADLSDGSEGCGLSVDIKREGENFNYLLKYDTVNHSGRVELERRGNKTFGIAFSGIHYAESGEDDNTAGKDTPQSVGGELQGDTILIQNYGNSMNNYLQFEGCQLKYLRLIKKGKN